VLAHCGRHATSPVVRGKHGAAFCMQNETVVATTPGLTWMVRLSGCLGIG
jgi:hypothetical protein